MDQDQNWEHLAHAIDDRYARCGGLAELVDVLDTRLDAEGVADLARIAALDEFAKTTLKEAWQSATSPLEKALFGGLAMALWDGNRRRHGEPSTSVGRAADGTAPPFRSMAAAWAFAHESRDVAIGAGPLSSVVAETSDLALAAGRAAERLGRERNGAGGFIPVEWMASSPTHVGGSNAKNEARVIMRDDVLRALDRSVEDRDVPLLFLVVLGECRRVPAARALGASRKTPQFEFVRLTMREVARLAKQHGDPDSEEAIKQRIARAKDAFRRALEARKLIPVRVERVGRVRDTQAQREDVSRFEALDAAERAAGR